MRFAISRERATEQASKRAYELLSRSWRAHNSRRRASLEFTWLPGGFTVTAPAKLFEALPGNENGVERWSISGREMQAGELAAERVRGRRPDTCNDMSDRSDYCQHVGEINSCIVIATLAKTLHA